jgi:hypothetical protein
MDGGFKAKEGKGLITKLPLTNSICNTCTINYIQANNHYTFK